MEIEIARNVKIVEIVGIFGIVEIGQAKVTTKQ